MNSDLFAGLFGLFVVVFVAPVVGYFGRHTFADRFPAAAIFCVVLALVLWLSVSLIKDGIKQWRRTRRLTDGQVK